MERGRPFRMLFIPSYEVMNMEDMNWHDICMCTQPDRCKNNTIDICTDLLSTKVTGTVKGTCLGTLSVFLNESL